MQQYNKPQTKKVRSGSAGRRGKFSDKRLAHIGGVFTATRVAAAEQRRIIRLRGGRRKAILKRATFVNALIKGKVIKIKIISVIGGPNPEHVRANIVTKGSILNTEAGKIQVTNRVGQDGIVNGKIVQ